MSIPKKRADSTYYVYVDEETGDIDYIYEETSEEERMIWIPYDSKVNHTWHCTVPTPAGDIKTEITEPIEEFIFLHSI